MTKPKHHNQNATAIIGAAFLMANSSIGPGFLNQTTLFTSRLLTSFGFVILISILLDLGVQLNTWRVLTVTNMRAQDLANRLLPGLGYFLSFLVICGGFAFNIGNIAGCGQGLNILLGLSFEQGAILSGVLALSLFWLKEMGRMLDGFTRLLGTVKILITIVIAWLAHPPLIQALHHTVLPQKIDYLAIVTIVGGTVGGYITFSGAHRLIDAGISGRNRQREVARSAISGIVISAFMRYVLFLAIVGVLSAGFVLDGSNPASTVFSAVGGRVGLIIFGVILWSAAISSVVGASYTSVSFMKTFHPAFVQHERLMISAFIIVSTTVFVLVGKPVMLLILAGMINGMILPVALSIILIACSKRSIMQDYSHPLWMQVSGWLVVVVMSWLCVLSISTDWSRLFP